MFKRDLTFRTPMMNAAGALGFAPEARAAVKWDDFGAFVTNPLSLRPRAPVANPEMVAYPGGFLLHTGLPNPGFFAVLKKNAPRWADSKLPIIVNLMADRPEETAQMVQKLEGLENIAAIELGFAPQLADDIIVMALEMSLGELPVIVSLPWEQVLSLGPRLIQAGAIALSLAAPRGALPSLDLSPSGAPLWGHRHIPSTENNVETQSGDGGSQRGVITGRLYGPALFPQALGLVRDTARLGLPIIGSGGIYSQENIDAMLTAGALAVQVDSLLWRGWELDQK
jgi:dihydroorotate dehydrogenase (NAD+) catalytic subunit